MSSASRLLTSRRAGRTVPRLIQAWPLFTLWETRVHTWAQQLPGSGGAPVSAVRPFLRRDSLSHSPLSDPELRSAASTETVRICRANVQ